LQLSRFHAGTFRLCSVAAPASAVYDIITFSVICFVSTLGKRLYRQFPRLPFLGGTRRPSYTLNETFPFGDYLLSSRSTFGRVIGIKTLLIDKKSEVFFLQFLNGKLFSCTYSWDWDFLFPNQCDKATSNFTITLLYFELCI
jgi:hypothetical protein